MEGNATDRRTRGVRPHGNIASSYMRGGNGFSETVGNSVLSVNVLSLAMVAVGLATDRVLAATELVVSSRSGKRFRELMFGVSNIVLRFHLLCSTSMNSVGEFFHECSSRPASLRISAIERSQIIVTGVSTFCGFRHQKKYDKTVSIGLRGRPEPARPMDPIISQALCTTVAAFAKRSALERSQTSSRVMAGIGIYPRDTK
jgi:hypothetical protein